MAETKKPAAKKLANYKNTTNANLYTESGRCAPNSVVALFPEQAKTYEGLELCGKK